ncbi:MAG TPA: glycoside hydrolase family 3 N-terminal domain-containing protein, partial [Polyangiaceae bacterium]|nr:glycoside hydrolase family 3 N-terminal domain-containing protein [Polyangiaceae bacterium]
MVHARQLVAAVSIVSAAASCTGEANQLPEQQTSRLTPNDAVSDRIEQLLAQMTLEEKATLLEGIGRPAGDHEVGFVAGVPRLGIPPQKFTDGPAGVRDGQPATALPAPVAVAASFDRALAHDVGARIGLETKARGYQVVYSPMINIVRVPQGGRNFETFGEDPFLAGQVGAGHIQGVQSQGVAAQVKHFAANNQERGRMTTSSNVDDRTLREIYLPAFETAVTKAGVWSMMCSYNQINGTFACENAPLLHSILKVQWGFDGVVGSDYPATHSTVPAANAGLDQEFGGSTFYRSLPDAVRSGQLAQSVLDDQARRVLRMMFRTGLFDSASPPPADPAGGAALARSASARGTVLLKNDTGVLPLDAASLSSIAVIGPFGNQAYTGGGGSSHVTPFSNFLVDPVTGIQQRAGSAVKVSYVSGASTAGRTPVPVASLHPAGAPTQTGLTVSYFTNPTLSGNPAVTTTDGVLDHNWQGNAPVSGIPSQNWSARWTGTLTVPTTGDYHLATNSDDGSRVFVNGALLIDNWGDHGPQTVYGTVHLVAGQS